MERLQSSVRMEAKKNTHAIVPSSRNAQAEMYNSKYLHQY